MIEGLHWFASVILFLIYKYIYLQMLTAHNGQLASFVCVMSYVFKFSIAYIHVYNDEKSPGP